MYKFIWNEKEGYYYALENPTIRADRDMNVYGGGGGDTHVSAPTPSAEEIALQREQLEILQEQRAETAMFKPFLYASLGLKEVTTGGRLNPEWTKWNETPTAPGQSQYILGGKGAEPTKYLGGTTTLVPMTTEEKAAMQTPEQRMQGLLESTYLSRSLMSMGYSPTGERLTEEQQLAQMSPEEQRSYRTNKLMQERQQMALEGKLPVSPAMEAEIKGQEEALRETLTRKLGSDWMTSTPGQQAWSEFQKNAGLLREEARRGQITTGEGLLMAREGLGLQQQGYTSDAYSQLYGLGAQRTATYANIPYRTSGLLQGYAQAQQPYQYYTGLQTQANIARAQARAQERAGLYGGIGSAAGSAFGAYALYAGLAV